MVVVPMVVVSAVAVAVAAVAEEAPHAMPHQHRNANFMVMFDNAKRW